MKKLQRMYYYTKNEKKLNCYYVNIPRTLVEEIGLQDKEIEITRNGNKIVIEEKFDK